MPYISFHGVKKPRLDQGVIHGPGKVESILAGLGAVPSIYEESCFSVKNIVNEWGHSK